MGVVHSQRLSCSRSPSHSRDHNSSNHSYTGLYVLLHKIYTYGCLVLTLSSPLLLSSFLPLPNFHLWFPDRLKPSSRATPRATRSPSPPWGTLPIPCTFLYIPNVDIEPQNPLATLRRRVTKVGDILIPTPAPPPRRSLWLASSGSITRPLTKFPVNVPKDPS